MSVNLIQILGIEDPISTYAKEELIGKGEQATIEIEKLVRDWENELYTRLEGVAIPIERIPLIAKPLFPVETIRISRLTPEDIKEIRAFLMQQVSVWSTINPKIADLFLVYRDIILALAANIKQIARGASIKRYPTEENEVAIVPLTPRFIYWKTPNSDAAGLTDYIEDTWKIKFKREGDTPVYSAYILGGQGQTYWKPPRVKEEGYTFGIFIMPVLLTENPIEPYMLYIDREGARMMYGPEDISPAAQIPVDFRGERIYNIFLPAALAASPEWNGIKMKLYIMDKAAADRNLDEIEHEIKLIGVALCDAEYLKLYNENRKIAVN